MLGRVLSIDYGERRIGLAVSDPSRTIASPAGFILRRAGKRPPIKDIIDKATELEVTAFVVGLPLDGNGEETQRSTDARAVGDTIAARTNLPVTYVDERYTTSAALKAIKEMEGSTRNRKGDVDSMAATLLLQHALQLMLNASRATDKTD